MISALVPVAVIVLLALTKSVYVINQYERGVVFRLGRLGPLKGPGLNLIIPLIDELVRVDQRIVVMDIPSQDVITNDNISIKVNAVLYFKVMDPELAITKVQDYLYATNLLAQTTVRSICGQVELDSLLSNREQMNGRIQDIIDHQTGTWGVKVTTVEIKHIDLPQEMQRAMARQAEAERDRRAKIIKAEGEYQAAEKLTQAAEIMGRHPATMQLRYLETLRDISVEHNSTILFPVPIEMMRAFVDKVGINMPEPIVVPGEKKEAEAS